MPENQQMNPEDFLWAPNQFSSIDNVIAVASGKGGVGKSLVTSLLASACAKKGHATAIMDADVTGPSIPKSFGLHEQLVSIDGVGIEPAETRLGTKVVSMNLLLDNEESPVVWRGPVVAGVLQQFWQDVDWGNVDYMFVDMPPGTGDVPLTVFQSLPIDGIIVVTSPQDLVSMIVHKAVNMAAMMEVPVVGLVENYSYFKCPDCGKEHAIFGESKLEQVAKDMGIPVLARMPIDPALAAACDNGTIEDYPINYLADVAELL